MIILGRKVRDKVTGFEGIVTGRATYLTGCDQYSVAAQSKDGKAADVAWYDKGRLEVVGDGIGAADVAGAVAGGPQAHAPVAR